MRQEASKCLSTSGAKEQKHTLHTVCWKVYISCLLKRRSTHFIHFIFGHDLMGKPPKHTEPGATKSIAKPQFFPLRLSNLNKNASLDHYIISLPETSMCH